MKPLIILQLIFSLDLKQIPEFFFPLIFSVGLITFLTLLPLQLGNFTITTFLILLFHIACIISMLQLLVFSNNQEA